MEVEEAKRIVAGVGFDGGADERHAVEPADDDAGPAVLEVEGRQQRSASPHVAGEEAGPLVEPDGRVGGVAPDLHPRGREPVAEADGDVVEVAADFPCLAVEEAVDGDAVAVIFEPVFEAGKGAAVDGIAGGLDDDPEVGLDGRGIPARVAEAEVAGGIAPFAEDNVGVADGAGVDDRLAAALLDAEEPEAAEDVAVVGVEPGEEAGLGVAEARFADLDLADAAESRGGCRA